MFTLPRLAVVLSMRRIIPFGTYKSWPGLGNKSPYHVSGSLYLDTYVKFSQLRCATLSLIITSNVFLSGNCPLLPTVQTNCVADPSTTAHGTPSITTEDILHLTGKFVPVKVML
jgi:hypothetical protein